MNRCGKEYRPWLVSIVKAMGQEVIDRAEDIVGNGDLISDLTLWLRFPQDDFPTIEVSREHISHEVIKLFNGKMEAEE